MIDSYIARDRSLVGFGRPGLEPFIGKYQTAESGHSVGGFAVADCPDGGLTSWSTVGASFIDTEYRTAAGKPVTSEFVGCAGSDWERFGGGLAFCAFYVADGGPSRYGTVIRGAFQHAGADVTTQHGFIVPPFCWENEFPAYEDEDVYTTWLQVVPITDEEAAFAEARDGDALEDLFEQRQPDLFDLGRASLI
ncbi:hypothetical protein CH252_06855 [Rhodococcus sp. 06-1477-1B]|nr:hypothetical protein CH252_06855 [Rhodococcus sp. 06-1477-1B]